MQCPYCQSLEHRVLESRIAEDGHSIRRRRDCDKCHKRFTTYERAEGVDLKVVKKDGQTEDFRQSGGAGYCADLEQSGIHCLSQ